MKRITIVISCILLAINIAANTISVVPSSDAVYNAISQSKAGDVLLLSDGEYEETQKWVIQHPLTIQAAENATPKVSMKSRIETYSDFSLQGVELVANETGEAVRMR